MFHRSLLVLLGVILLSSFGALSLPSRAQSPAKVTANSSEIASSAAGQERAPRRHSQTSTSFEASPGAGEHLSIKAEGSLLDQTVDSDHTTEDDGASATRRVFIAKGNQQIQSAGLTINATFDSSITGNPNSAAIQAMINQCVGIYQSLFKDPITVSILFRYSTTSPNGSPLSSGTLAQSGFVIYPTAWTTFVSSLVADAKTANDATANASLPAIPLSTNVVVSSADGRALGLNTPAAMFADGHVGTGGPYDGIVTLNSAQPFQFTRPVGPTTYDAQRSTEHEMDEVLGLGSFINSGGSDVHPQDLFSWSSPGTRNLTTSGIRYFSINSGATNIVGFNQMSGGDFGDWVSPNCPQP